MKKLIMFAVFASMMFTACSNEEISPNIEEKKELGITASIFGTVSSRALVNNFSQGDQIRIFINGTNYSPKLAFYTLGETSKWNSPTLEIDKIYLSNETATIFGFYPANAVITGGSTLANDGSNQINVSVPATVNIDGETNVVDYMYATGPLNGTYQLATASNEDGKSSVDLVFHHALSKISFIVNRGQFYTGNGKLSKITLSSTAGNPRFQTGNLAMNIGTGVISGDATSNDLIIDKASGADKTINAYSLTPSTSVTTHALFAPLASTANIDLKLVIDGKEMSVTLPTSAPDANKWLSGINYTYTITVNGSSLVVNNVTIKGWDNISSGTVEVE